MSLAARSLPIVSHSPAPRQSLPTVTALERLWEEVAAKPLWAPPRFFTYLKLRWRMRLRLLDAQRLHLSMPAGKINDCSTCTDICCIGPRSTVLLRLRDVATLKDIGRTDLMTQKKPEFTVDELGARPALRRQVRSAGWSVFPVLKQNTFGACAALSVQGKCLLYPHWPMACARFPFSLHLDDEEIFYSQRCQSFWIRPDVNERATEMAIAAVSSYNERIKDMILLAYAPRQLSDLGLAQYLSTPPGGH